MKPVILPENIIDKSVLSVINFILLSFLYTNKWKLYFCIKVVDLSKAYSERWLGSISLYWCSLTIYFHIAQEKWKLYVVTDLQSLLCCNLVKDELGECRYSPINISAIFEDFFFCTLKIELGIGIRNSHQNKISNSRMPSCTEWCVNSFVIWIFVQFFSTSSSSHVCR